MGILSWTESYGEKMFMNFDMSKLRRDEAYLNVSTSVPIYLYGVYRECYQCPYTKERAIARGDLLTVSTRHEKLWGVLRDDVPTTPVDSSDVLCSIGENFEEFGVYGLTVSEGGCRLDTLKEPVNIYFPILTVVLLYLAMLLTFGTVVYVATVYFGKVERGTTSHDRDASGDGQKKRLKSLDTFRGISIVLMIFVNYGSGGYAKLDHAVWNGLQAADVVFPWFMWIMGVCIPISVASIAKKGIAKKTALLGIFKRSCILFAVGLFLTSGPYLDGLRIFGVLQRFGVCYFVVASVFVLFSAGLRAEQANMGVFDVCKDVLAMKYQWMVAVVLLIIHSLITFALNVPNCPTGYLGPGGLHANGRHRGCTGGAAGYIDRTILKGHMFQDPTSREIYGSDAFDPEGILGCLTSIVQVIIGSQAGTIVLFYKEHAPRLTRLSIWAVTLGLMGGLLCGFSKEDGFVPVNKNLWSLSFVMVTSSFAFFLLAFCYYLIDVKDRWSGKPFIFAGMNAIFMYVGHSMIYSNFPFRWIPTREFGLRTHFVTFFENVWATGMWVIVAYYLYRIKYFLSI